MPTPCNASALPDSSGADRARSVAGDRSEPHAPREAVAPAPIAEPARILVIDDSQVDRLMLHSALEEAGFQVCHTDSALSAFELMKLEQIDVVVADVVLPGLSGVDLLRVLHGLLPNLPVVLVTSSLQTATAVAAVRYHAFDYLLKPVAREHLVSTVRAAVASIHAIPTCSPVAPVSAAAEAVLNTSNVVIEHLPNAVMLVDLQGQVLLMNRLAEELLGTSRSALLGHSFMKLTGCPAFREFVASAIGDKPMPERQIVHLQAPDGPSRSLGCSVRRTRSASGPPPGTVLLHFSDITQEIRMKAAMIQADRLASLGTMASALAHDINNPLSVALGTLGFLLEDLGSSNAEVSDGLRIVERNTWKCVDVVRNFLKLSRAGRPKYGPVFLDRVIDDILRLLNKDLAICGVRVALDVGPTLPAVEGNETQLQQILLNLIVNARDAMEQGGTLTLRGRREEGKVVLEVGDTGAGIAPELLGRIFDSFFTTKPPGKGTGLGLAICRALTHDHGGSLDAVSELGAGTTFTLRLPVSQAVREALPPEPTAAATSTTAYDLRILAVDDEADMLDLYRQTLVRAGCRAAYYTDPAAALREFVPDCFDLALIDVCMPDMNGFELCRKLLELDSSLPVVFASGTVMAENDDKVFAAGGKGYISKPFRAEALRDWLDLGARTRRAPRSRPLRQVAPPRPRYRLLVVDDDDELCRSLAMGLEAVGPFQVATAYGGLDGVKQALASPPDLILLDLVMPDLNGFEVCRELKSNPRTARVPIVMLTVKMDLGDVAEAMQAGASHYLMKPMDIRALATELLEQLGRVQEPEPLALAS